jgi:hypothetical protein
MASKTVGESFTKLGNGSCSWQPLFTELAAFVLKTVLLLNVQ